MYGNPRGYPRHGYPPHGRGYPRGPPNRRRPNKKNTNRRDGDSPRTRTPRDHATASSSDLVTVQTYITADMLKNGDIYPRFDIPYGLLRNANLDLIQLRLMFWYSTRLTRTLMFGHKEPTTVIELITDCREDYNCMTHYNAFFGLVFKTTSGGEENDFLISRLDD